MWIRFEGKSLIQSLPSGAQDGKKAEHARKYVTIFEPTCNTAIGPQTGF
jgi:hypothetical protein